ncbi:MAG TPA: hypothetical protein VKG67_01630 [Gallionellaceae bacterium]|nr:hypothetical protein [Gallionellaceae bacterium]
MPHSQKRCSLLAHAVSRCISHTSSIVRILRCDTVLHDLQSTAQNLIEHDSA